MIFCPSSLFFEIFYVYCIRSQYSMTVYCQMEIHYISIFHFIYILSADGLNIKYLPEVSCIGLVSTWWIQSNTERCPDLKDTDLING